MSEPVGPGPHPLVGRQSVLVAFLRGARAGALALALAGVVLPDGAGTAAGVALVVVLVATPVVRVTWLLVRWVRRGDVRFAGAAAGLLAIVGIAAGTAL